MDNQISCITRQVDVIARFRRLWSEPSLGPGATDILEGCRARIHSRIQSANAITTREVLAVGANINSILEEAKAHVDEVQDTLGALTDSNSSVSLVSMLDAQSNELSSYLGEIGSSIQEQNQAAQDALAQVAKIVDLGFAIGDVAAETKVLALNANIEASRMGSAGRAMAIIASEMTRLNGKVEDTNTMVAQLARELARLLPRISELTDAMQTRSESFSNTLTLQLEDVARGTESLRQAVSVSLTAGDARLATILDKSYDALSHLQFEDPVAQDLRLIENDIVSALQDLGVDADEDGGLTRVSAPSRAPTATRSERRRSEPRAVPSARKRSKPSALTSFDSGSHREGGEDRNHLAGLQGATVHDEGGQDVEAGDVMLF